MVRRFMQVLAVSAASLAASPALAAASQSEFVASRVGQDGGSLVTKGASGTLGNQMFQLGVRINCADARTTGTIEDGSPSLLDVIKFSHCTTPVGVGGGTGGAGAGHTPTLPATFDSPLELRYSAATGDATLVSSVTIQVNALKCSILLEKGTLENEYTVEEGEEEIGPGQPFVNETTSSTKLKSFPTGYQKKLAIHNVQAGIEFHVHGELCALDGDGGIGIYSGVLSDEVVGGNLEFRPNAEWDKIENKEEFTI